MANEEKQQKHNVTVIAPAEGKWAGGRQWTGGRSDAEVTEDELVRMAARDDIQVYLNGKRVKSKGPAPTTPEQLTADEVEVLREYRAEKARNPKLGKETGTEKPFELVDEKNAPTAQRGSEKGQSPHSTPPLSEAHSVNEETHPKSKK